jgi:hypothetical protein
MSVIAWMNPNFWYQLRFFRPHKVNGKWNFIKRDIVLPYNWLPQIEKRLQHLKYDPPMMSKPWQAWVNSSIYRRWRQDFIHVAASKIKRRGVMVKDFVGFNRRRIRYSVY